MSLDENQMVDLCTQTPIHQLVTDLAWSGDLSSDDLVELVKLLDNKIAETCFTKQCYKYFKKQNKLIKKAEREADEAFGLE